MSLLFLFAIHLQHRPFVVRCQQPGAGSFAGLHLGQRHRGIAEDSAVLVAVFDGDQLVALVEKLGVAQ
ncbi:MULTISPECIES: hypothetical protein [Pseudomonas]|uniref:hypothetical protein n=1 Tax=Pseudomonas TaxID=286 RepID=UPI001EE1659E|nr:MULTISPECIES: hypothetical protein [Pseudomonas]MCS4064608.1 hypothetical protein [Pseudomonas putida]MDD1994117.1 hypothetical protein [Pseudomonas putida]